MSLILFPSYSLTWGFTYVVEAFVLTCVVAISFLLLVVFVFNFTILRKFAEEQRHVKANDLQHNATFNYAVSIAITIENIVDLDLHEPHLLQIF